MTAAVLETVERNGRTFPRYVVGVSRGYVIHDLKTGVFHNERPFPNKRTCLAAVKRLNRGEPA